MIPLPPKTIVRPVAYFDTECYHNLWLLKVRPKAGGMYSFKILPGQTFSAHDCYRIKLVFQSFQVISFNGINYDIPMIDGALSGLNCEQLKFRSDQMIVHKIRKWELPLSGWEPDDHIDVMEVAPGAGGQKQYAGRIHCKTMRDLPYAPDSWLSDAEIVDTEEYCENDLDVLEELHDALAPQIRQRVALSEKYGIDLRSKSDAQVAEAVLKKRCEEALGKKIYKPELDTAFSFAYRVPDYISFATPVMQYVLQLVRASKFTLSESGRLVMPEQLESHVIEIGQSRYKIGIGGLHSQESCMSHVADDEWAILSPDVASYYPALMLNSGEFPPAMGNQFLIEYDSIRQERLNAKAEAKIIKQKLKTESSAELSARLVACEIDDAGGKIQLNGTFGKTGSPYSVMFAPTMLIQTTITGQLSLLMLIEWLEYYGFSVISANTDGIFIKVRRVDVPAASHLIAEWEKRTSLTMETSEFRCVYSRDVNNYFAIDNKGDVKRKGEYAKSGLVAKKNPDVEICSDAVAEFLLTGASISDTIFQSRDIRKFVTIQKVNGGAVKMWGHGPMKDAKVSEMVPVLEANGWVKQGRSWTKGDVVCRAGEAYVTCFGKQTPEYLGKVVRWYYGTRSPGPIVYATNGNTVSLSYGATPCMTLPDDFPTDIDYDWYINKANAILKDIGYSK